MIIVAVALICLFAVYVFRLFWQPLLRAKKYGTETDAYVSRIENDKRTSDGADYPRRFYYVSFRTESGLVNEARLLNPKGSLVTGSEVRIRYLPEKADSAVLTDIIKI